MLLEPCYPGDRLALGLRLGRPPEHASRAVEAHCALR